ncbi:MAG: TetR/AcrR family transcriptional regulator [Phycisphaerales bacterium]
MSPPGRPREFDEDLALDRAMELFRRHGYDATGVQQLVEHTGVCRQSLYNTFGDKRALFDRVMQRYRSRVQQELLDCLDAPGPGVERIRAALQLIISRFCAQDSCGCLITRVALELTNHDPELQRAVRSWIRTLERAFRSALRRAADDGALPPDADPDALAAFLTSSVQGLIVTARTGASRRRLNAIAETILASLE